MTEARPADPVDPALLLDAFMVMAEGAELDAQTEPEKLGDSDTADILDRIASRLGTPPRVTTDLFRRCCAMSNFFAVESNRALVGVDDSEPPPEIWAAAASVTVHQVIVDGLACDTYDPREFLAAVRGRLN